MYRLFRHCRSSLTLLPLLISKPDPAINPFTFDNGPLVRCLWISNTANYSLNEIHINGLKGTEVLEVAGSERGINASDSAGFDESKNKSDAIFESGDSTGWG